MSDDVTFEQIEPLVAGVVPIDGGTFEVVFWCRATGVEVRAQGRPGGGSGMLGKGAALAKGRLLGMVREGAARSVRRAITTGRLPGGMASAAHQATGKLSSPGGGAGEPDADDQREAVLNAFETVADRFRWDDASGAFVGVTAD
nr:hypothetical protein [Acidimicrobiia bacterium]